MQAGVRPRFVLPFIITFFSFMSLAPLYFILFGTVSEVFGILGWVRAKSKASLIAGVASGLLLSLAGILGFLKLGDSGLWVGGVVSLALLGRFLPAFLKTKALYPAGIMATLALGGVVIAALHLSQ
jgi:uncharacterized membrane protein (UPF0136 family)